MQKYLDEFINTELSFSQIAAKYHIKLSDLVQYARSKGYIINRSANKHIILNLHKAIKYYLNENSSIAQTASKFGIFESALSINLKKLGYKVVNNQNKLRINENIFDSIDTEEKAYWLGFIYADGCIYKSYSRSRDRYSYRLSISLKESDYSHLVKFNNFIQATYNKVSIKKTNYKDKSCCKWQINNKHLFDTLNSYGCTERKSLTLKFPNINIFKSYNLVRHFIRGYFDGDGSISFNRRANNKFIPRLILLGTYDMLDHIIHLVNINTEPKLHCDNEYTYTISLTTNDSWKLMHYMYDDCTIYLDRKYERYLNFINNAVTEENLRNY